MDSKALTRVEVKSASKGEVSAVFATFNVVDKDGDVTLPGAFEDGADVLISAYGHKSWQHMGAMPPVGKGRIRVTPTEAILEGQFFMDTAHGRDAFNTVKGAGDLQEWSYGFNVLDAEPGTFLGKSVQFLKKLFVKEVSPVFEAVGVNTRTLAVKSASPEGTVLMPFEYKAAIRPHDTKTVNSPWNASAVVKAIPDNASVSDLRSVFAWVDSNADPESKSSYKFPHHMGVNGPANIRACVAGIAALNGARGGSSIPDADRKGVYNHLANHLRDADKEPPELRSSLVGSADGLKFHDELTVVLCDLSNVRERASEVVALRRQKGRAPLASGSAEILTWIDEELRELKSLLNSPEEDAAYEYLRFVRSQFGE